MACPGVKLEAQGQGVIHQKATKTIGTAAWGNSLEPMDSLPESPAWACSSKQVAAKVRVLSEFAQQAKSKPISSLQKLRPLKQVPKQTRLRKSNAKPGWRMTSNSRPCDAYFQPEKLQRVQVPCAGRLMGCGPEGHQLPRPSEAHQQIPLIQNMAVPFMVHAHMPMLDSKMVDLGEYDSCIKSHSCCNRPTSPLRNASLVMWRLQFFNPQGLSFCSWYPLSWPEQLPNKKHCLQKGCPSIFSGASPNGSQSLPRCCISPHLGVNFVFWHAMNLQHAEAMCGDPRGTFARKPT